MSTPVELSSSNVDQLLAGELPVLVDCWAEWCVPCKQMSPAIDAIAEEFDGLLIVAKLDVDSESTVADRFDVKSLPTLLLFEKHELLARMVGAKSQAVLEKMLRPLVAPSP